MNIQLSNTLLNIQNWQKAVKPIHSVAFSVHFEEIVEFLDEIEFDSVEEQEALQAIKHHLSFLKDKTRGANAVTVKVKDRVSLVDALADQIVTAVGVGVACEMDVSKAAFKVDNSNWSKFDERGNPIRDNSGKVIKGPRYVKADLKDCV